MKQVSTCIHQATIVCPGSVHGGQHYLSATRGLPRSEREEHRKAARIALDTSAHAGSMYNDYMRSDDDQDELASPAAAAQHSAFFRPSTVERASSINIGKLSVENQQALFHQNLPPQLRSELSIGSARPNLERNSGSGKNSLGTIPLDLSPLHCAQSSAFISSLREQDSRGSHLTSGEDSLHHAVLCERPHLFIYCH